MECAALEDTETWVSLKYRNRLVTDLEECRLVFQEFRNDGRESLSGIQKHTAERQGDIRMVVLFVRQLQNALSSCRLGM